jgi:hypothetical protein
VIRELCLAVAEGRQQRELSKQTQAAGADATEPAPEQPRRSRRAQFRADDAGGSDDKAEPGPRGSEVAAAQS